MDDDGGMSKPDFVRQLQYEIDFSLVHLDGHWKKEDFNYSPPNVKIKTTQIRNLDSGFQISDNFL